MRFVAFFCFILASGCASADLVLNLENDMMPKVIDSAMKCAAANGFDLSFLDRFRTVQGKAIPKDEKFLKLFYCAVSDLKVVTKDGHFIESEAVKFVHKKQRVGLRKALEECNKETGTDTLDVLYNVSKCIREKNIRLAL